LIGAAQRDHISKKGTWMKNVLTAFALALLTNQVAAEETRTPIIMTMTLIGEDGSSVFSQTDYYQHTHNGLSISDIAQIHADFRSENLSIIMNRQINEMPGSDSIVYTYKHPTGELSIFTVKNMNTLEVVPDIK
jgi:hypothetical protein